VSLLRCLNGVAAGLASSFVSRNNDVGGYWALGQMKALALGHGSEPVTIHLAPLGDNSDLLLEEIAANYNKMLGRLLEAAGLPADSVSLATISTRFRLTQDEAARVTPHTRGEPFASEVTLVDRRGRAHAARSVSTCAPHDPWRERRSARRRYA